MAAGWIYRRPPTIRRRRFVPQTFAAVHVVVRHRRAATGRRQAAQRRHIVLVAGTAAATGAAVVRALRVRALRQRPIQRVRRAVPHGFTTPQVVIPSVLPRLWRYISRIRRAMQQRLRRPRREQEIPPELAPERIIAAPKGRIFSPGGVRGRIVSG